MLEKRTILIVMGLIFNLSCTHSNSTPKGSDDSGTGDGDVIGEKAAPLLQAFMMHVEPNSWSCMKDRNKMLTKT